MSELHLTVSEAQRALLARILNEALKAKRVEVHRTEFSREFRHELEAEEREIQAMLESVQHAAAST
jgi:hypothetical protein